MARTRPRVEFRGLPRRPALASYVTQWVQRLRRRHGAISRWDVLVERQDWPQRARPVLVASVAISEDGHRPTLVLSQETGVQATSAAALARQAQATIDRAFLALSEVLRDGAPNAAGAGVQVWPAGDDTVTADDGLRPTARPSA